MTVNLLKRQTKSRTKKASVRSSGDTRAKIIQRSILLFNREGLRNVAVERISADLDISVGNLTYYFPRKQQLIVATLEVVKAALQTALAQPTLVSSGREGAEYLVRVYRTLWENRFFFNALTYVLTDPQLRREYGKLRLWALESVERDLDVLCGRGYFLPAVAPNNFELLSENMWDLWLSWLRTQHVLSPSAKTPDDSAIYDCALHNWSLCQPWMSREYARDLLREFGELLPARARIAGPASRKAKE